MKNVTTAVIGIAIIGAIIYLTVSTTPPPRPVYRASYLLDRTDSFPVVPTIIQSEDAFTWDAIKQAREIRIRRMTDVVSEDVAIITLPVYRDMGDLTSFSLEDNDIFRRNRIRKLEEQLDSTLSDLTEQHTGYANSAIMEPIVQELVHLQQYPNDDRELYVFSDLGQNTLTDNWIGEGNTIQRIASDDTTVWSNIEGTDDLINLVGIHVHIIHRPATPLQDQFYRSRAKYLKARLTELGATVSIHGGINRKSE